MKVYVVTAGSYEDYRIRKVFLDEEKAKEYVELSNLSNYDDHYYLETYDTSDDLEISKITYVEANYTKWLDGDEDEIFVDINFECSANSSPFHLNNTSVNIGNTYRQLKIERVIENEFDEDSVTNIYQNLIKLIMIKVEELIESDGYTEEMLDNWLKEHIEEYF
jgi:hypothetical protein